MPRVLLTEEERQLNRLYNFILGECFKQKIRQKDIGEELCITQSAVSYKFNDRTLSLSDFVKIMNLLGKDVTKCID
jgi:predicted transcriptional regulator